MVSKSQFDIAVQVELDLVKKQVEVAGIYLMATIHIWTAMEQKKKKKMI